jgi:hypothetical protein
MDAEEVANQIVERLRAAGLDAEQVQIGEQEDCDECGKAYSAGWTMYLVDETRLLCAACAGNGLASMRRSGSACPTLVPASAGLVRFREGGRLDRELVSPTRARSE